MSTISDADSRRECDPKDAQVMLHMLQIGAVQIFQDPMVVDIDDTQELSKTHDAVSRAKTELWHRISLLRGSLHTDYEIQTRKLSL